MQDASGQRFCIHPIQGNENSIREGKYLMQYLNIFIQDAGSVERALLCHEKKFPPMLPRILRVARAKNLKHTKSANDQERSFFQNKEQIKRRPKVPSQVHSSARRASSGQENGIRRSAERKRDRPSNRSKDLRMKGKKTKL